MGAPVSVSTQAGQLFEFLMAKKIELVAKVFEEISLELEQARNCLSVALSLLVLKIVQLFDKSIGYAVTIECQTAKFRN